MAEENSEKNSAPAASNPLLRPALAPVPLSISRSTTAPAEGQKQSGNGLKIGWSDGIEHFLPAEVLRRSCPCASCCEERGESSHSAPLAAPAAAPKKSKLFTVLKAGIDEQTDLVRIWPVGNYALGLLWGDNHDSGIYEYSLLRKLGQQFGQPASDK